MADKTLDQLVTEIESELYQVSGVSTQVYSQDMIIKRINDAFITFFDDKDVNWKRFLASTTYVLNGTTGETASNVSSTYLQYDDILHVYPATSDTPLTAWNILRNPVLITGSQPLFVTSSNTSQKIFKVVPATATGSVVVIGKTRPAEWPYDDLEETVKFDYLALKYYVAWQMMVDDGANPASAEKLQKMFTNRYKELERNQAREPIALNGRGSALPTSWFDPNA